jgi:aryl-alcohol dehydrogenase-like predicted oxidoreductase
MKYRILGSTGLKVSVVGVGTWQFGGEWAKQFEQDEVDAMFDRARELGINLIDTAECYGDHTSEAFIGRAPAVHEHREDWIIATKFGHKFHAPFQRDEVIDPQGVKRQLEDSLRALRTDYVDLYQFHSLNDQAFDTDRLWETLEREKEAGRIRHLGVSIGSNRNTYQTGKAPDVGAEAIQVVYNRLDRAPEEEVLPLCEKHNLGVLARVPLASGYLSGKYSPADAESFAKNDVRGRWHGAKKARQSLEEAQRVKQEEVPEGVDMAQWALAWCLTHPAVTCVIPGCKSVGQVESNAAAADLDLVREDHPQAV